MKNWRLPKNARTFVLAITSNELHTLLAGVIIII